MNNEQLLSDVKYDLQEAVGYDADNLAESRAEALDYYHGNMKEPAKGNSAVVSMDVADTIHAIMSQATTIYKSSNVEFPATSEDDESHAQLESDYIKTVLENNDEYDIFEQATFDALLQRNGWIHIDVETDEQTKTYMVTTESEALALINDAMQAGYEYEHDWNEVENQAEITIYETSKTLVVKCLSPDSIVYSGEDDTNDVQMLRLVGFRKLLTVAELMELGLSEDDAKSVPTEGDNTWLSTTARQDDKGETADENPAQAIAQIKETFVLYYLYDKNNSGELTRYRVHLAGDHIIECEPINFVPMVTGSPLPLPHRIEGQGMYQLMKQVQDSKTSILRNYIDNLGVMNRSRVGYVEGEVNTDDLLNGRINGAVACETRDSLWSLESNDIGAECIQGLNYLDQVRTQRGGAALDLNDSQMQIAQSSALAAGLEYSAKEKMAAFYCKNLAQTLVKDTFILIHRTMRDMMPERTSAKVKGKWIETVPGEWPERLHAKVIVGMSDTERNNRAQSLAAMMGKIEEWLQLGKGGILTDESKLYNVAADWIKTSQISDNPEEYLTNPDSEEAQQVANAQAEQQQQQMAAMQQAQQQMAAAQLALEEQKINNDKLAKQMETQFKYFDALLTAQTKEGELTLNQINAIQQQSENLKDDDNTASNRAN